MPRSNNPYDLIDALETKYMELTGQTGFTINSSEAVTSARYIDTNGGLGLPGETYTKNELKRYWYENRIADPILNEYDSFEDWWDDMHLTPVSESTDINAVDDIETEEDDDFLETDDPEINDVIKKIVKYNIATKDEIQLVCDIVDDAQVTMETLNDIIHARTGYDDIESYLGEVYPE